MIFLRNRQAYRYRAELVRGHPVYERIQAEVLAKAAAALLSGDGIPPELNQMRARAGNGADGGSRVGRSGAG